MTQDQHKLPEPTAFVWHQHLGERTKSLRWTNPNQWEYAEKVEPLYTEAQVRELLSAHLQQRPLPVSDEPVAWMKRTNVSSDWDAYDFAANQSDEFCIPLYRRPLPVREHAPALTERLQQKCSDWGTYWRAPDAHGVVLTQEQALELLRDALGVEVEFKDTKHG